MATLPMNIQRMEVSKMLEESIRAYKETMDRIREMERKEKEYIKARIGRIKRRKRAEAEAFKEGLARLKPPLTQQEVSKELQKEKEHKQ